MKTLNLSDSTYAELLAALQGTQPVVATKAVPDGFVRVTPTGPNAVAHGVSRLYPTMQSVSIPWTTETPWSYPTRLAFDKSLRRPDGSAYCQMSTIYNFDSPYVRNGLSVARAGGDPTAFYAEWIDRVEHGGDWASQVELDKAEADARAHAGAVWVPDEQPKQGGETPI